MRPALLPALLVLLVGGLAAADEPATIDNPEFAHWSKFKAGTWVKIETEMSFGDQATKTSMTHKLVELTKEKAVVETTMVVPGADPRVTKRDVAAKIPKPPQPPPRDPDAPKPDVKISEETVEAAGRTIKCKLSVTTMEVGDLKVLTKSWTSEEVPGHLVKMESKSEGGGRSTSTTSLLKEWKSE